MTNQASFSLWWGRVVKASVVVCVGALMLAGCGVPDYVTGNEASVYMRITSINAASPLLSDVSSQSPDYATVSIAVRNKNLRNEAPNVPNAVFLERYEVVYVRSDGRNTEGVDVPYRISGNLTIVEDVRTSGGTSFSLEVVRAQAKLEPPLRNLRREDDASSDLADGGGAIVITVFAEVTLYGRTTAGQAVEASGSLQIDFADWG
jgi:hypothetical protein